MFLLSVYPSLKVKNIATNVLQSRSSESTLRVLKICAPLIFFLILSQKHLGMCNTLPVECPDGCGTIVVREKVKDIMKTDTNCPPILTSTRAISGQYMTIRNMNKNLI